MKVLIPTQLQKAIGSTELIYNLDGAEKGFDVKNLMSKMISDYPLLKERLINKDNKINKFVNVFVNDEDIRFLGGEDTILKDSDVVSIIPAIAGG